MTEIVEPTSNTHVIRAYKERAKKPDEECTLLTLATRRYAYLQRRQYERRSEEFKQKAKDRYYNDPQYRLKKLANMKAYRERQKQLKMEQAEKMNISN